MRNSLDWEIKDITKQLIEKYKPQKVILFGSAAWGEGEEPSDLDFFIVKDKVPYLGIDRMREVDRLIDTEIATDFLVVTPREYSERLAMNDPFVKKIADEGEMLYG